MLLMKKGKIYPLVLVCILSIIIAAVVNLFNLNISSDVHDFINGIVFGINLVGLVCIALWLNKGSRERLKILVNDERNQKIQLIALSITVAISFFVFVILGITFIILNYDNYVNYGKIFIGAALFEELLAFICWIILYRFL